MAFTDWVPEPLKFIVFGVAVVTSTVPEVMVSDPAMPITAAADNLKYVPFTVTLKRLAVPDNKEVEVKVTVPAVAEKVPETSNKEETERLTAVVTDPGTSNSKKVLLPVPLIDFDEPAILIVPLLAMKLPETVKSPLTAAVAVDAIVPVTERS